MKSLLPAILLLALCACSTNAELKRPEDIVMIRGSYTTISVIWKWLTGGTEICQLTGMEKNPELLTYYSVILDKDGCTIMPACMIPPGSINLEPSEL